jgi:hypothetical protein
VEHLKGDSLGSALALLANNSPGRKGLPGTDALACLPWVSLTKT